jgi:hypothetical protein
MKRLSWLNEFEKELVYYYEDLIDKTVYYTYKFNNNYGIQLTYKRCNKDKFNDWSLKYLIYDGQEFQLSHKFDVRCFVENIDIGEIIEIMNKVKGDKNV